MRGFSCGLVAAGLITVFVAGAHARAPVSSLQPAQMRAGVYEYDVGLSVVPFGQDAWKVDEEGHVFMENRLEYTVRAYASVRYRSTERLAITVAGGTNGIGRREAAAGAGGVTVGPWSWVQAVDLWSIGMDWRFMPDSVVDPVLRVTTHPGDLSNSTIAVDGRLISDPVFLAIGLAVGGAGPQGARRTLTAGSFGVGFVANDRITVTASVKHVFPTRLDGVPQTNVVFGVQYALNDEHSRAVAVDTSLTAHGGDVRLGFGLTWFGSGGFGR